ncbi:MAG TPA: RpiB/LacA/LacB family sugar-phosphate isomerase [Patescibacteria group bacterium]|jgi:ribose 5-phosphate isomerase B|nr:RpiB/LacA/LacB family sugar-phosphate isomerase [Patescibacteria group bacterium]
MKLIIGTDHRGYMHKEYIKKHMSTIEWVDIGCLSEKSVDYPIIAHKAVELLNKQELKKAILLCGSGIGMCITANRYPGIFAALVWNAKVAKQAREHENANILVLPSDYITEQESIDCIDSWLAASFLEGNYARRCAMIDNQNF